VLKWVWSKIRFGKAMLRGLIIAIPVVVIAYVLDIVIRPLDFIGRAILRLVIPSEYVIVGTGLIVMLVVLFIIGRIDVYYEERKNSLWRRTIRHIPVFGSMLSSGGALSLEQLGKMTPCKFWLSDTTPHYGFIVREQKVRGTEAEIDVYRPNVPSIIPGDLMPLKRRLVIKLANPAGEVLQKLASGGFFSPEEEIPVPWDDESDEEFQERIRLTPLEIAVRRIIAGSHSELPDNTKIP
jgi:uncharacterized membrane protein